MAFSLTTPGSNGAVPNYADLLSAFKNMQPSVTSLSSSGTTDTLSGQQIASGIYVRSGATTAVTCTTDTAANIITALGPNVQVGQTFMLLYVNLNTSTATVTVGGGTGVTVAGTATIPIAGLRCFVGTVTGIGSSAAVVLNGAWSIGSGLAA